MKKLILDIETSPNVVYSWGLFNQNIGLNQIIEPGRMIAVAAKWHGEDEVHFFSEFHNGPKRKISSTWQGRTLVLPASDFKVGHQRMVEGIYSLINQADVVIHFNGMGFDMPWIRKEIVQAGLPPHKPVAEVDLLRVVKNKKFRLTSNKLEFVATQFLGLEGKLSHSGFDLWSRCLKRDPEAWAEMKAYNEQDITVTEAVYDKLRPWIHNHPTPELFEQDGVMRCAGCEGTEFQKRGTKPTAQSMYQWYSCKDCGKHRRGTKALYRISNVGVA